VQDNDFALELAQMVLRRAAASHLVDTLAFVAEIADRLSEDPVFGEFKLIEYIGTGQRGRQIRVHGVTDLDDTDGSVGLVIGKWTEINSGASLTTAEVNQLTASLENFISESMFNSLSERITESHAGRELASRLGAGDKRISRIRLHIFVNQPLSSRFKEELREPIGGIGIERHIWDINRIQQVYESSREREALEIDVEQFGTSGIPCLEAAHTDKLRSYLCVIEGNLLAELYARFGSRLLEGNVRSFLGMKGGVNKGIRSTIQDVPSLFFAYNNGIAATATDVHVGQDAGRLLVRRISDLQIVNGGQTTASILSARKKDGLSLDGVTIPMKLTVVDRVMAHDLIPKIAEYANTQNKIATADFFANHPFHRKMEEISRRLTVPAKPGVRIQSKWFYERARGQYQNERLYLSKAKRDAFELEFPSEQVINKTDLAKLDSVWREKPYWASLGAQKNFAKFADQFASKDAEVSDSEYWTTISPSYGDEYYQRIASIAVLWGAVDQIVSLGKGGWYLGDYRSQIISYAIALLFRNARARGGEIRTERIWQAQSVDGILRSALQQLSMTAQQVLLDPPAGTKNVGEWAKKDACWDKAKAVRLELPKQLDAFIQESAEFRKAKADSKKRGEVDDGIALQKHLLGLVSKGHFQAMLKWQKVKEVLPESSYALVSRASTVSGFLSIATDKEWKKLVDITSICEQEGFRA
jgi:hypothetical protein